MARIGFAVGGHLPLSDLVELAKLAEARGYDSFWMTEGGAKDAFSQVAALAFNTKRIRLGTGIAIIYSRSPTMVAMQTAALDEMSSQRFILGLGVAGPGVKRMYGVAFDKPLARMKDYVAIIRQALEGRTVSYKGEAYSIDEFRLSFAPKQTHAPIYIAALGLKMVELAGEVADGVLFHLLTPDYIREAVDRLKASAERAGRDPARVDVGCFMTACPSPDTEAALAVARQEIVDLTLIRAYQNVLRDSGFSNELDSIARALANEDEEKARKAVSDRMLESLTLVGDVSRWNDRLQQFRDAGVKLPIIFPSVVGGDEMASLRLALTAF